MPYYVVRKNAPIKVQIKAFQDKKSGKVTEARKDILHRFACLDWTYQKKILDLFLDSGKSDREWAYTKLLRIWDDSFTKKIKVLWEMYHEDKCSWVIIRHLPERYIAEKMIELDYGRNYFFICMRLGKQMKWRIDKNRLSILDYLSLYEHIELSMEDSEALDLLYILVHDICVGKIRWWEVVRNISRGSVFSATSFPEINTAIQHVYGIGCQEAAIAFENWNENIKKEIIECDEYKVLYNSPMDDSTYQHRISGLGVEMVYKALDSKYKKTNDPSIEEMRAPFSYYSVVSNEYSGELPF